MNNEPVAWMVDGEPYLYNEIDGEELGGIPLYTHPVTEHFEDEPQAEELHEIMQSNAELTDAETALKSLYEAIIRYENLSLFPDKYAIESCEYQLHDAKEKARAILRKASEK